VKEPIEKRKQYRDLLYQKIDENNIDLVDALKLTRKIVGKSQQDYAHMVGLSKKIITDFERGKGNPTLDSLIKMFKPVGLIPGLKRRKILF